MNSDFSNIEAIKEVFNYAKKFAKPPERLTPSEWAEKNIRIPIGNAISGYIRFDNAPYQREPLDMIANPECNRITLMWGAQTGKTQLVNCAMGYHIAHDPQSQIMMQPSQGDLHTWLETKFNPMVEANDSLLERIAKPRGREGVNNQRMKSYYGGFLMFAWSGSPKTMRGRSAPKIYCDEVDGYEVTTEGHPVSLLWQRSATFGDQRLLLVTSTPSIKGASTVEDSFLAGDQRYYHIKCPHCGEYEKLEWKNVQWDRDGKKHLPETAGYFCPKCGSLITDGEKIIALRNGKWIAKKPFNGHASYHLSELYSFFRKWKDVATSFLEKKAMGDIQSFTNISLAETWQESAEQADPTALMAFAENYTRDDGIEIVLVTAGADVQKDRIEIQVVGWDANKIPYIVCHDIFYGEPMKNKIWQDVDGYLKGIFCGHKIARCLIDSGYLTDRVYSFTKQRHGRGIFPCKGEAGKKEAVSKATQTGAQRAMLIKVGIDSLKHNLLGFLKDPKELIHFSHTLDAEFFKQLTAEKMVIRKIRGFPRAEFTKTRDRNEALDCFVYAYASMLSLNFNFNKNKMSHDNPGGMSDNSEETKTSMEKAFTPQDSIRKAHKQRKRKRGFAKRI